jgi:hypothetical protein
MSISPESETQYNRTKQYSREIKVSVAPYAN